MLAFSLLQAQTSFIPAPKLELIKQAMSAMRIDQRIQGLVDQRIAAQVEEIRILNSALPDSLTASVREVVAEVYAENMDGRDGLMSRVYTVLDRRLTEDDLQFAVNFKGSDQGRRYRELVPRVVSECLEAGRLWSESLEPEVRLRLEQRLRSLNLNF